MTYTCIATKGVHEVQKVGLTEKQKQLFESQYLTDGYVVLTTKYKPTKTYTESQVKEMILSFYNEFISTTIEIGEKEVDNWMERRNK